MRRVIQDEWPERAVRGVGPHPYDPCLPDVARAVARLITEALPGTFVEHVGSTAVPGLPGKSVVDLQIVAQPSQIPGIAAGLLAIGFERQTGLDPFPATRPMLRGTLRHAGVVYGIHCHVLPADDPEAGSMLEFRDLLRRDPELREAYAALKQRIVEGGTTDPLDYTKAKTEFISSAMR